MCQCKCVVLSSHCHILYGVIHGCFMGAIRLKEQTPVSLVSCFYQQSTVACKTILEILLQVSQFLCKVSAS